MNETINNETERATLINSIKVEKVQQTNALLEQCKNVSLTSSNKFNEFITTYYTVGSNVCELMNKYANTLAYYKEKIDVCDNSVELENLQEKSLQVQAIYKHLKKETLKQRKNAYEEINDTLYSAYVNRFSNRQAFENAITLWLKKFDLTTYNGVVEFVINAMGCKSSNLKRLVDDVTIENLSKKAFSKLFLDTILQIALINNCISNKVIKKEVKALLEIDVKNYEFTYYPTFTGKESKKILKERLSEVGFDCTKHGQNIKKSVSKWLLSDYVGAYKKALRQGYFLEY